MTDVHISIVNHENRDLLAKCLASLPAACRDVDWTVTVVDNASRDGSIAMMRGQFPDVDVIANQGRRGFGANHNQVLRRVLDVRSARYVLVLNDDTELRPAAVSRMVEAMDLQPLTGAIVPTITVPGDLVAHNRISYPTVHSSLTFDVTGKTEAPDPAHGFLQGCCLMLRVEALARVGLFDERFFLFYEDVDLSRRLEAAGWLLAAEPDAEVFHLGHASVWKPDVAGLASRFGLRSRYLYFEKYLGPRWAAMIATAGRLATLARVVAELTTALRYRDRSALARARVLVELSRFDPRRPGGADVDSLRDGPVGN